MSIDSNKDSIQTPGKPQTVDSDGKEHKQTEVALPSTGKHVTQNNEKSDSKEISSSENDGKSATENPTSKNEADLPEPDEAAKNAIKTPSSTLGSDIIFIPRDGLLQNPATPEEPSFDPSQISQRISDRFPFISMSSSPRKHCIQKRFSVDIWKNNRMWDSWKEGERLRTNTVINPREHAMEYYTWYKEWVFRHSGAPHVVRMPDHFKINGPLLDAFHRVLPSFNPDAVPLRCELPSIDLNDKVFGFDPVPDSAKLIFDPVSALAAFDMVHKIIENERFVPMAPYIRPIDIFRLVDIGWIKRKDLRWADVRAQYYLGWMINQDSSTPQWVAPEGLRIPSFFDREENHANCHEYWSGTSEKNLLWGEKIVENTIVWIDADGLECKEAPIEIDQEIHEWFLEDWAYEPPSSCCSDDEDEEEEEKITMDPTVPGFYDLSGLSDCEEDLSDNEVHVPKVTLRSLARMSSPRSNLSFPKRLVEDS